MPGTMTKGLGEEKACEVPVDSSSSELGKATKLRDAKNTKEQRTLYSHVYASLLWAKPERILKIRMEGKDVLGQARISSS